MPALPDSIPTRVEITVAPDEAGFGVLAGGAVPEWGAAVAIPSQSRIVVPGYASPRTRGFDESNVLLHEWAHIGLHEMVGGRVPRWFSEGYAEWASAGWNPTEAWRLRMAMALRQTPSLDSLTLRWPAHRGQAEIAYLLSATAVDYLVSESGVVGLERFIDTWAASGNFESAFRRTYGVTTGQFEEDWREFVRGRYGWLLMLSESVFVWTLLGIVLLALWWTRRRRSRERMARLRATEPATIPVRWTAARLTNPYGGAGYLTLRPSGVEGPRTADGRTSPEDGRPISGDRPTVEHPQE